MKGLCGNNPQIVHQWFVQEQVIKKAQLRLLANKRTCFLSYKASFEQFKHRLDKIRRFMKQTHIPIVPFMDKRGVYWQVSSIDFRQIKSSCRKEIKMLRIIKARKCNQTWVKIYWANNFALSSYSSNSI